MNLDTPPTTRRSHRKELILDLALLLVFIVGAYFRLAGIFWGEYTYLHPDERFLVWVGADITPIKCLNPDYSEYNCPKDQQAWMSFSEYFDSAKSTLNPVNRGHGFYVYGTLPMFITRFAVQWLFGHSGFDEMTQVGRVFSVIADLLTVLFVYLIAMRLYNRRVGVLAAAFSAAAVMQIQQSHFFTMDTFINFFTLLALYFAILVVNDGKGVSRMGTFDRTPEHSGSDLPGANSHQPPIKYLQFFRDPLFFPCLGFGIALGMAVASKLNAAPMALVLPGAMFIRLLNVSREERKKRAIQAFLYLAMAGLISILVFRVSQPYTFSGPGFFGLKPDARWLDNMRELRAQSTGVVAPPFALQWARRPITFSGKNLTLWGLGLPLGILAWAGFLSVGWRIFDSLRKRNIEGTHSPEWQRHAVLWGWTAFYFAWQSTFNNPTMRYQLPVYPGLAIFAAWLIIELWDKRILFKVGKSKVIGSRVFTVLIGGIVLILTVAYAWGFTQIYLRSITRVEASRWLMQNVPGPINLHIQTNQGNYNQPLPFPYESYIRPNQPFQTPFAAKANGELKEVYLGHINSQPADGEYLNLNLTISLDAKLEQTLATASLQVTPETAPNYPGGGYLLQLDQPISLMQEQLYYLTVENPQEQNQARVCGPFVLHIQTSAGMVDQDVDNLPNCIIRSNLPFQAVFSAKASGTVSEIFIARATDQESSPGLKNLTLSIYDASSDAPVATATVQDTFVNSKDPVDQGYLFTLDAPIEMVKDQPYTLVLSLQSADEVAPTSAIQLSGAGLANEGDWDDGIPMRLDGYDPFGGIYPLDLNFNMYTDDNPAKLAHFQRVMEQSEYLVITSNRQWASLSRIPERYPMINRYYRNLLGCPPERDIIWCYSVAEPGMFQGDLGFELVKTFTSEPSIGLFKLNSQFAEEAFTVYDHPKVFVFHKTANFNPQRVRDLLSVAEFFQVIQVQPMSAPSYPSNLKLSDDRLAQQYDGGTWSELFDTQAPQNRFPALGTILWYLSVAVLGFFLYPMLRLALPGLADHGYPLARTAGMLLLSYLVWLAGSFRVPFTRPTIAVVLLLIALLGAYLAYRQRDELRQELRERRTYFLVIEGLALAFFLFVLFIRLGNPDLWHPYKGGEKPMDFAYFNAVLRSTTFPPYDPWYAGGYLNYYYYGFVLVGVLVKFLGIVPAVAYNLILPTIFSLIALGAFSLGWNLVERIKDERGGIKSRIFRSTFMIGLSAALGMAVLGNLGTLKMIVVGYERLAMPPDTVLEETGAFTRAVWAVRGFSQVLSGDSLPYGYGDWYWNPSRAIPAPNDTEPITEFPFFTTLYADPHAHFFALPLSLLVLAFALSIVLSGARWKNAWRGAAGFILGGMAIGALRPTNTWDFYPYLAIGIVAITYAILKNFHRDSLPAATTELIEKISTVTGFPSKGLPILAAALGGAIAGEAGSLLLRLALKGDTLAKQQNLQASSGLFNLVMNLIIQIFPLLIALGVGYALWEFLRPEKRRGLALSLLVLAGGITLLAGLSFLLYQPYAQWYALGYTKVNLWKGTHTPTSAYLTHWGLFLFVIVSWMVWETRDWMAKTPLSHLRKLERYLFLILGAFVLLVGLIAYLMLAFKVSIAWLVLPLAAWAGLLLLRPDQTDAKRFILFLVGTGLVLTLMVEVIVLVGDVGRMNTVFKFYLEVWTLFAVSAAAALGWLLQAQVEWRPNWRVGWRVALALLVICAALFTLLGGMAKVKDRMVVEAPHTLDGMAFMAYASYDWKGEMDLSQDYRAIRWMEENVVGSPVIVEANLRDLYRWGSRFSIYTGLPGVVGWEWHQQQQRAVIPGTWISDRIKEIDNFYQGTDLAAARLFLLKYNVHYIILGQLEKNVYSGPGLDKFPAANGVLWREVYRDGETAIYEVMPC